MVITAKSLNLHRIDRSATLLFILTSTLKFSYPLFSFISFMFFECFKIRCKRKTKNALALYMSMSSHRSLAMVGYATEPLSLAWITKTIIFSSISTGLDE